MQSFEIGNIAEEAVAELYRANSFKILARNFYNHRGKILGEIDFVAFKNNHLHFVEVKARSANAFVTALESFTHAKRRKVLRAAVYFLTRFPSFAQSQIHFDLAAVELSIDKSPKKIKIHSDAID